MNISVLSLILFLVAGGVGYMLCWFIKRYSTGINSNILKSAQDQLQQSQLRVQQLENKLDQCQLAIGRSEELARTNQEQRIQLTEMEEKLEEVKQQLHQREQERIKIQEQKDALEKLQVAQEAHLAQMMSDQEKHFQALQEQSKSEFNRMTAESVLALKKQTEDAFNKSRTELQTHNSDLLSPLNETMSQFKGELEQFKASTISNHTDLKNALTRTLAMNETLSKEAENLTNALKSPKMQGNWGELTLEEVLIAGGLREGLGYHKQTYFNSEEKGRQFPDFIVNLPGDRHIIIDSKMSMNSYVKWCNSSTDEERESLIKQHIAALRKHIDELSTKEYQKQLAKNSLDFVFMFIPIEYAYFAAIKYAPELVSYAKEKLVALVTPSNLFAVIQVVYQMWRVENTSKMMDQILNTGTTMHKRVIDFVEDMQDIKKHLDSASQSYDKADKHLRGRQGIIKSAQALEELGVTCKDSLKPLLTDESEVTDNQNPALIGSDK